GLSSVIKRDFFRLFWAAYNRAFTTNNILSGWANTRLNYKGYYNRLLAHRQTTTLTRLHIKLSPFESPTS
ncbi:uncharacterized protein K441DRAFT_572885, partial [Cenococcum geophilum 1.58]|uniref:uncharacterized protein n=1 Tax=Cenococcum geophilum 1.58 TaxID=794803 RepID=UPI00358DF99D